MWCLSEKSHACKNHKGCYAARCSRCKQFVNLTEGTLFEKTRLSFKQIFFLFCSHLFDQLTEKKSFANAIEITANHAKVCLSLLLFENKGEKCFVFLLFFNSYVASSFPWTGVSSS